MTLWATVAQHISEVTGTRCVTQPVQSIRGGCINSAYRLTHGGTDYFVKVNTLADPAMFEAEAAGLQELGDSNTVKVPHPICWGQAEGFIYLVLEYWPLKPITANGLVSLGGRLAALHRIARPYFGWHRDNTIGATPQHNTPGQDWIEFWRQHRLGYQLQLAKENGYGGALQLKGEQLMAQIGVLFADHTPNACSLHGDLWGGNMACSTSGEPVIFDPATYYGDRETDVAMTELFGGFGSEFYAAYQAVYPLSKGYRARRTLYNLYHILNHLNLFGRSYLVQAERMMDDLLSAIQRCSALDMSVKNS
ncbi:MAG: fructosamine kinase family protein [Candidatus Competibacteraceae bacterium]|nr:fructosamine kinase family protein [Candidatus Competibacteraceae bacterium]